MSYQQKTIQLNIQNQNIFFTADNHFSHTNIIKYCERPFPSVEGMNSSMIKNWNNKIKDTDIIFILGDFCWGSKKNWLYLFERLNGHKYLTQGNHDKGIPSSGLVTASPILNVNIKGDEEIAEGQRITCSHYPMLSWYQSHRGSWQLYGHVHGRFSGKGDTKTTPNQLDVGVDVHGFAPISYEEIKTIITKRNLS